MEPNIFDKVHDIDLKSTMEKSYIDYAMSVIAAGHFLMCCDGLKPVQRRVLFSMIELNNGRISLTGSALVLWAIPWVNTIPMETALFTEPWSIWLRNGLPGIRW